MSGWWKRRKLPQSKPDGSASSLPEGASGETGHFAVQPGCAVKRFKMASACALAIISGRKLYIFGIAERLRALRYPIFTGGVVEGNGICSACFLRKRGAAGRYCRSAPSSGAARHLPPTGGRLQQWRQSFRACPLPLGGAVAQRLRGCKSAEPEKTVKRSSRRTGVNLQFFPV